MIVNVRGTNGSGKTTVVREIMKRYDCTPVWSESGKRKTPIGYTCKHTQTAENQDDPPANDLWIMGPYTDECQTGGCDLIKNPSHILDEDGVTIKTPGYFSIIEGYAKRGFDVLFEGIVAQHCTGKLLELKKTGLSLMVIGLTTPVPTCIERVRKRRAEGLGYKKDLVLNPDNLIREARAVENALRKLRSVGVDVSVLSIEEAINATATVFGC